MKDKNTFKIIFGMFCFFGMGFYCLFTLAPRIVSADTLPMSALITLGGGDGIRPVVSNVSLNSGTPMSLSEGNMYNQIYCTATATDAEGCYDILDVSAKLYRTGVGSSCSADLNNCYLETNANCQPVSGSCTGGEDLDAEYQCAINNIAFFADPTDAGSIYDSDTWTCEVYATDSVGSGASVTDTEEMGSLNAIGGDGSLMFGMLTQGQNTGSTPISNYVTNYGNTPTDVEISGTDWNCYSPGGPNTLLVGNIKYSAATFDYSTGGTAVTTSPVSLEVALPKPTVSLFVEPVTAAIYWGLAAPWESLGYCNGQIIVSSIPD
jgi:hypothetical protein